MRRADESCYLLPLCGPRSKTSSVGVHRDRPLHQHIRHRPGTSSHIIRLIIRPHFQQHLPCPSKVTHFSKVRHTSVKPALLCPRYFIRLVLQLLLRPNPRQHSRFQPNRSKHLLREVRLIQQLSSPIADLPTIMPNLEEVGDGVRSKLTKRLELFSSCGIVQPLHIPLNQAARRTEERRPRDTVSRVDTKSIP